MRHIIGLVSYEQNSSILESEAKHVRARNPFTPRERYVLAYLSLAAEGVIGDVDIIYVPYLEPSKWDRVDTYLPVASIFCTTNKDSADIERDSIFRRMGRRSILLDVSGLDIVNSSAIKDAILGGQPWQQYLHPAVHTYFESIDGPRRLAEAAS